ncbi:NIPSNAP family protein [Azohydromonas caseinilytica]|uniref:NIPSNAP family protein n=1 Tax=Azohydromonas caseinilytica TaxID=2728836 RepID=A0A848FCN9_9BURK|nr:NIPSNAP family protein [Azohydromonas caseinilytica]NML17987.1 NIPSNAP family protein [Azohydromonas caseinilytica]
MYYELATLTTRLFTTAKATEGIQAWVQAAEARGQLLGCWYSDIGALNQILVLRGFNDEAELLAERRRALLSSDPFHCGALLTGLEMHSYAGFPWMEPPKPGSYGPVYEVRTYQVKTGGLQPTLDAWKAALPARNEISPCLLAMYALDGTPRFTHFWPAASLNERSAARADAVKQGVWPPKGGPDWLTSDMQSQIFMPTAISPLK